MKLLFISLGCDKNLVDSEVMLGMLTQKGYEITDDEEQADAVVINTCCFIGDAKEESINTILEMGKRRVSGQLKALIVTGCLAQRYHDEIQKEIVELIAKYPDRGEMMLDFLMVAKYFERIGDHATNVAEWVEFSITGERPVMTKYTFDQKTMEEKKLARDERVFKRVQ